MKADFPDLKPIQLSLILVSCLSCVSWVGFKKS
jgi:hypothetical protein